MGDALVAVSKSIPRAESAASHQIRQEGPSSITDISATKHFARHIKGTLRVAGGKLQIDVYVTADDLATLARKQVPGSLRR
jgi:hypothetical protein